MLRRNPQRDYPHIDKSAYIDPTTAIIGKINIGKNMFIGPGAVIIISNLVRFVIKRKES